MARGTRNLVGFALLFPLIIALVGGCGGSGHGQPALTAAGAGTQADISDMQSPPGVDAGLWEELKQTLSAELARNAASSKPVGAPQNEINKVRDFQAELTGGEIHFSWSYRNVGDYDLNGEVNASDLVPVAQYFGATEGEADWEDAQAADGDENGEINMGDVTPIAANFNNSVTDYLLEGSAYTTSDWWPTVSSIALDDAVSGNGELRFTYVLENPGARDWYRIQPQFDFDGRWDDGILSDPLQIVLDPDTPPDPPLMLSASDGDASGQVTLSWFPPANATGYHIYRDSQQVSLAEAGEVTTWADTTLDDSLPHTYWLTAFNAFGESDFSGPDTGSLPYSGGGTGQGEWWTFGHDRQRTGRSESTVAEDPQLLWAYEAGSLPTAPVFGSDGTIYFATKAGKIYALNPDATTRWMTDIGSPTQSDLTLSADGTLLIGSGPDDHYDTHPILHALDTNGAILWTFTPKEPGGEVISSPLVAPDGTIYFGDTVGEVFRLDHNGNQLQRFDDTDPASAGGRFQASLAMSADGTLYIAGDDGRVYALDAELNRRWFFGSQSYFQTTPVLGSDGTAYVGSNNGNFYALNPDGSLRWKYDTSNGIGSSAALAADGTVYFSSYNGKLYAFSADGTMDWSRDDVASGIGVVDSAGTLICISGDPELLALDSEGAEKWRIKLPYGHYQNPVLDSSGRVYIGVGNQLLCFGTATELPAPPAHAPDNVQASDQEFPGYVAVTWDKVPGATNYRIYRDHIESYPDRPPKVTATVQDTDRWTDTALAQNADYQQHFYWVVAVNPYGASGFSESDTGSLGRRPADPGPGDWNQPGHGPKLQRRSPVTGPPGDFLKKWTCQLQDGTSSYVFSEPVTGSEGRIYVVTSSGWLIVVNPNGSYYWKLFLGVDSSGTVAVGASGQAIVGMDEGNIIAVDPAGDDLWRYSSGLDEYMVPTLADDGTIYASSTLGNLYSISPAGELNWKYEGGGEAIWQPAIDDNGTIYFATEDHYLFAVNPDGSEHWRYASVHERPHVAIGTNGDIILRDDQYLSSVHPDGSPGWSVFMPTPEAYDPAIGADGTIYLETRLAPGFVKESLSAYSPAGELLWNHEVQGPVSAPIVDGAGRIYFIATKNSAVYALGPDGTETGKWTDWGEPTWPGVLSLGDDGTLYLLRGFESLYAFGPKN